MSKRMTMILGTLIACLAIGCAEKQTPTSAEPTAAKPTAAAPSSAEPASPNVQIANPASVNCVKVGGQLEIRKEPAGEYGVCVFSDGSRCEEWRLFRKECKPGECRELSGQCPAK